MKMVLKCHEVISCVKLSLGLGSVQTNQPQRKLGLDMIILAPGTRHDHLSTCDMLATMTTQHQRHVGTYDNSEMETSQHSEHFHIVLAPGPLDKQFCLFVIGRGWEEISIHFLHK